MDNVLCLFLVSYNYAQGYILNAKYYGRWRGDGAAGEKIKVKMRCNVQGAKEKEKIASKMG